MQIRRYLGWGMGKRQGVSMPSLGMLPSQHLLVFINPEALWTCVFGIFMEASSCSHNQLLTQSLALLSYPEDVWDWNFQASTQVWTFWWSAPNQELTKICHIRKKDAHIT